MKLYCYKLIRDFGFAPNPFPPFCTLATCKPDIRLTAQIDEWIVGVGSSSKGSTLKNKLIYAMRVSEKLTYDEYWSDPRFQKKKPVMNGSKRQMYGDNIYHRDSPDSPFIQENSHHSLPCGEKNILNYKRDIPGEYVLISKEFWYFGSDAILIPENLLQIANVGRGYKVIRDDFLISGVIEWLRSFSQTGYIGRPYMFDKDFVRYSGV